MGWGCDTFLPQPANLCPIKTVHVYVDMTPEHCQGEVLLLHGGKVSEVFHVRRQVHNGISFSVEQEKDKLAMNPKCAILLHMVNLFAHRYEPDHQMVQESTWQWVFRGSS